MSPDNRHRVPLVLGEHTTPAVLLHLTLRVLTAIELRLAQIDRHLVKLSAEHNALHARINELDDRD